MKFASLPTLQNRSPCFRLASRYGPTSFCGVCPVPWPSVSAFVFCFSTSSMAASRTLATVRSVDTVRYIPYPAKNRMAFVTSPVIWSTRPGGSCMAHRNSSRAIWLAGVSPSRNLLSSRATAATVPGTTPNHCAPPSLRAAASLNPSVVTRV